MQHNTQEDMMTPYRCLRLCFSRGRFVLTRTLGILPGSKSIMILMTRVGLPCGPSTIFSWSADGEYSS
jgi:hypothetical protein